MSAADRTSKHLTGPLSAVHNREVADAIREKLAGKEPRPFCVQTGYGRTEVKTLVKRCIAEGRNRESLLGAIVLKLLTAAYELIVVGPPADSGIPPSKYKWATLQKWLDYQATQDGRKKGSNKNKAQCMLYEHGSGHKHNIHRDHNFNKDKCTILLSPHADGFKNTGGWNSQVVKLGRSRLTVEKEVTIVPSDGQWLCLTPWSNAVNTHCWGFGATDGPTASRLGLQFVFVIGAGQPRLFVEWLVTELMK